MLRYFWRPEMLLWTTSTVLTQVLFSALSTSFRLFLYSYAQPQRPEFYGVLFCPFSKVSQSSLQGQCCACRAGLGKAARRKRRPRTQLLAITASTRDQRLLSYENCFLFSLHWRTLKKLTTSWFWNSARFWVLLTLHSFVVHRHLCKYFLFSFEPVQQINYLNVPFI